MDYLDWLRWPSGPVCPRCGRAGTTIAGGRVWRCGGCDKRVSRTAGTIFQDTGTPLTVWFAAGWYTTAERARGALHGPRSTSRFTTEQVGNQPWPVRGDKTRSGRGAGRGLLRGLGSACSAEAAGNDQNLWMAIGG